MTVFAKYADYYDLFYQEKDYASEANAVHELLSVQKHTIQTILEFGSGTGRHAIELANKGYVVQGIDRSKHMVNKSISAIPRHLQYNLSFHTADARSVSLSKRFDSVIALFHVMSYQITDDDVSSVLHNASRHLREDGILIFDIWYGPGVLALSPESRESRFKNETHEVIRIAEPILDISNNQVEVLYTICLTDLKTGSKETFSEKHLLRFFFLQEINTFVKKAGFSLISSTDSRSGRALQTESWSATVCAKKSPN